MPDFVHYFDSTQSGAPTLSGTAGALITVLDACLINGYGSVTVTSLVVTDGIATATVSGGHGLTMLGSTGPVIQIAGATPAGLNGNWCIASIPNATTFTFACAGISNQTATGTITAKRAPVGWEKRYSGTNKAGYARTALTATTMLLRVDDTPAQYPTLIMYETMSDVDTGTGPAPTTASYFTCKSNVASAAAKPWRLYADARMVYLFINADTAWSSGFCFGDIIPYFSADAYHCVLIAPNIVGSYHNLYQIESTTGSLLARSYTQVGAAILSARYSHRKATGLGNSGNPYPNPVDNAFHAWPVEVWDGMTQARGMMPGLWNPIHAANSIPDGTVISDIPALPGRTLVVQQTINFNYRAAIDITGPWR